MINLAANLSVDFSYPWLLLLLIPAVVLVLIAYLRVPKKYRNTRNRICSIVLHVLVMVCSIFALSGMSFSYTVENTDNELILLVDVSDTQSAVEDERDSFVQKVLDYGQYDGFKIGIVTFGFTQVYAVPMTYDIDTIYEAYITADMPDTSATDIAAALTYTKGLFTNPESSKIVLITDGKETDEDAAAAIRAIAAQGTVVDTAYIASDYLGNDVQLTDVKLPDYHVTTNNECNITVTLQSTADTDVTVALYDNGVVSSFQNIAVSNGTQSVTFAHTFTTGGLHELYVTLTVSGDALNENNSYYSYLDIQVFNDILIFERSRGQSDLLVELLTEDDQYVVTVINLLEDDASTFPTTVDELRKYDQVILNNISNADMEEAYELLNVSLVSLLSSYVYDYGGGLFTTGGTGDDGETANAYNRSDLYGTLLQAMLPVEAINYTPPLGLMIVIDVSGSMGSASQEGSSLNTSIRAAISALDALSERDYVGVIVFDDEYEVVLPLTSMTQKSVIIEALNGIFESSYGGGTVPSSAIERAGQLLHSLSNVEKRHMLLITDGDIAGSSVESFLSFIEQYYNNDGTTLSIIKIGGSASTYMEAAVEAAGGSEAGSNLYDSSDLSNSSIYEVIYNDLNVPALKETSAGEFYPTISSLFSVLVSGVDRYTYYDSEGNEITDTNKIAATLGGYYGTKLKSGSTVILTGDYDVPIYAQRTYGAGTVGSFMCDLYSGGWGEDFITSDAGSQFILNVISAIMPTSDVTPSEISIELNEENYINKLSVYSGVDTDAGEYIVGTLFDSSGNEILSLNEVTADTLEEGEDIADYTIYVTTALTLSNNYSRCNFVIKDSGVYIIRIIKYDAQGNVLASADIYKEFSYSKEYDIYLETTSSDLQTSLQELAASGGGVAISDLDDPYEVYEGFITDIARTFDPVLLLIILTIILFLLDIAVRKFKFKWPHELIREYKRKKADEK